MTHSGSGVDQALTATVDTTLAGGSAYLRASLDEALPPAGGWLRFRRGTLRAEAVRRLPGGFTAWAGLRGGAAQGQLPPHEAFTLGGPTSVRGYKEGALAAGSRYGLGNAELSLPLARVLRPLGRVLHKEEGLDTDLASDLQLTAFCDCGTDFGSAGEVLGSPALVRGKPGRGWGSGLGVKASTPLGPIRVEYTVNDQGQRPGWRFNIGSMGVL